MLRRRAVLAGFCLMSVGNAAFGLGLGEIKVESALNQRFEATIPITSITPDEAESLKVGLADNDAFARAGLERSTYLSSVSLEAVTDGGNPRIVLRGSQIAHEPLLTILIEVKAGGPRILREYTVFLDPPKPENDLPPPVMRSQALPQAGSTPSVVTRTPQGEFYETPSAPASASSQWQTATYTPGSPTYGPVHVGETLWGISTRVRPDSSHTTVEQVMLALFEANPTAFNNGDIDSLRKGTTLSVPGAETIKATDAATAKARVHALMEGNGTGAPAATASSKLPPLVTPPLETVPRMPPPETVPATPPATVPPAPSSGALPATLPPAPSTGTPPAASGTAPATGMETPPASAATGTGTTPATPPVSPATPPAPATATVVPVPKPISPQNAPIKRAPQEGTSLVSLLVPILILLILLAIALAVWRTMKEKKAQREYEAAARAQATSPTIRTGSFQAAKTAVSARDELEAVNRKLSEEEDAARTTASGDDDRTVANRQGQTSEVDAMASTTRMPAFTGTQKLPAQTASGQKTDFDVTSQFEANTLKIDLGANDPISEADFHLAYGLYDEAALLLKQASDREPDRTDLRMKLAETFFAAGKPVEFQDTAEGLKPQLGKDDWRKLAIMGRQLCPDAEVFKGDIGEDEDVAVDLAFDEPGTGGDDGGLDTLTMPKAKVDEGLDFALEELELPGSSVKGGGKKDPDAPLEFDLGEFDLGGATQALEVPPVKLPESGELSLKDFDLGDPKMRDKTMAGIDIRLDDIQGDGDRDALSDETISAGDEVSTKLDLARAYVEMGDAEMARSLLDEVAAQGSDDQKREATQLRERLSG